MRIEKTPKQNPKEDEVWLNSDHEICRMIKVHKNTSALDNMNRPSYRIVECTEQENPLQNIFEVKKDD